MVGGVVDRNGDVITSSITKGRESSPSHHSLPPPHPQAGVKLGRSTRKHVEEKVVLSL